MSMLEDRTAGSALYAREVLDLTEAEATRYAEMGRAEFLWHLVEMVMPEADRMRFEATAEKLLQGGYVYPQE